MLRSFMIAGLLGIVAHEGRAVRAVGKRESRGRSGRNELESDLVTGRPPKTVSERVTEDCLPQVLLGALDVCLTCGAVEI